MVLFSIGFVGARCVLSKDIKKYFGLGLYLSVAGILAAGCVLHNAVLFMVFAGAVMLITASSRIEVLCRLTILVVMIPNVSQGITIGGLYVTTISTPVVLSFAALIACYVRRGAQQQRNLTAEDALVFLLMLCFGIGAVRAGSFTGVQRTFFTMALELGLPYFVYRRFVHNRTEFAHIVAVLAGSALILSFVAICEAKLHWSIYDIIYTNQFAGVFNSRNVKLRAGFLRAPASFSDSTAFAIFEIIGIFAVISSRRFFRTGLLWSGSIALAVLGLIAAQSRGANLGLLFGLFLIVLVRRRYVLAGAVAGGGAAIVALLLAIAPFNPTIASFMGAEKHVGTDQDYRQTLLRRGLQVGMEHPILGDDITRVTVQMADIKQGDGIVDFVNSYLSIFLNSGLVGLGLFIALVIVIVTKIFRFEGKSVDKTFTKSQMFVMGALGSELLALTFTPVIYERNAFLLMITLAGCRNVFLNRPSKEKSGIKIDRSPYLVTNGERFA